MKLDKPEKIQLFYDSVGAFFCAAILGTICSFFVAHSSSSQPQWSFWQYFHFFLPFVFYPFFIFLFWRNSAFKPWRLNFLWILVNLFCPITTLFFSFFIRDVVNKRFLTEDSKFLPFNIFLSIIGSVCGGLLFCAFFFWLFGRMHRFLVENKSRQSTFNLIND